MGLMPNFTGVRTPGQSPIAPASVTNCSREIWKNSGGISKLVVHFRRVLEQRKVSRQGATKIFVPPTMVMSKRGECCLGSGFISLLGLESLPKISGYP